MNYVYGSQTDEIDPFFRAKREWSKVKDRILHDYIVSYLKTIQSRGRPIFIIDAFAGPGRFGDGTDGSPRIICDAIKKTRQGRVKIKALFADSRPAHRAALETCIQEFITADVTESPLSDCAEALSRALQVGSTGTLFFYLDPYGIKDLEFEMVKQIYERDKSQSTEVLINFSFPTFMRLSENWSYGDSADEVARKVKQSKTELVSRVMNGEYWLEIVTNPQLDKIQRENAIVGAYLDQVRQFFPYAYSIPVKELDEDDPGIPTDSLAKYHLIFGTRSARAVVYMNDAAKTASEPYFNTFKNGVLFDMTPERYQPCSVDEMKGAILGVCERRPMTRPQIFEAVIPNYFMHHHVKEYRAVIGELAFTEKRLFPDPRTVKREGKLNDETLLATRPWPKES